MSARNIGSAPSDVGIYSFRLRDSAHRIFTVDFSNEIIVQLTAEDHFGVDGLYDMIQPGLKDDLAVVFLVPTDATGLHAERCLVSGCDGGAPNPPAPPAGCSIAFSSFYTEANELCGTVTETQHLTTIQGSAFYAAVDAPPGSNFVVVFMTVSNFSYAPTDVGIFSFRLRDGMGRSFSFDFSNEIIIQLTAESYFGVLGLYDVIQPGLTSDMAFVFLTPTDASGFYVEPCRPTGCL